MNKNTINIILKTIVAIMLIVALSDNPYDYYTILRWIVCGISAYLAYISYESSQKFWMVLFIITGIVFNPIYPIYLNRETWRYIDIGSAIIFVASIFTLKENNNINIEINK